MTSWIFQIRDSFLQDKRETYRLCRRIYSVFLQMSVNSVTRLDNRYGTRWDTWRYRLFIFFRSSLWRCSTLLWTRESGGVQKNDIIMIINRTDEPLVLVYVFAHVHIGESKYARHAFCTEFLLPSGKIKTDGIFACLIDNENRPGRLGPGSWSSSSVPRARDVSRGALGGRRVEKIAVAF